MATPITKYADQAGTLFDSEGDADASNLVINSQAEINAFVATHFPTKPDGVRGNPHAGTATKAINLWIAHEARSRPSYRSE